MFGITLLICASLLQKLVNKIDGGCRFGIGNYSSCSLLWLLNVGQKYLRTCHFWKSIEFFTETQIALRKFLKFREINKQIRNIICFVCNVGRKTTLLGIKAAFELLFSKNRQPLGKFRARRWGNKFRKASSRPSPRLQDWNYCCHCLQGYCRQGHLKTTPHLKKNRWD